MMMRLVNVMMRLVKMMMLIKMMALMLRLGKGPATKSDEFLEKFRMAFDTPPSFLENYHRYGYIYARRYDGQIL